MLTKLDLDIGMQGGRENPQYHDKITRTKRCMLVVTTVRPALAVVPPYRASIGNRAWLNGHASGFQLRSGMCQESFGKGISNAECCWAVI